MRQAWLLIILLFPLLATADTSYNTWWQKGNAYYENKQFDSAARYYQKLTINKPENPEIYFNLGNAYYRLNQIGPAVLNYERALKFDPDNKAARDNLALAQNRISNRVQETKDIFFVAWWKALTQPLLSGVWAFISVALFILCLVILLAKRWNKLPYWLPTQVLGFLIAICCLTLYLSFVSAKERVYSGKAVVMQEDVPLFENAGKIRSKVLVPEGTVVEILNEHQGWREINLPDGRTGWVSKDALEKI